MIFSFSRWTNVPLKFMHLLKVCFAIKLISYALLNERDERETESDSNPMFEKENIITYSASWSNVKQLQEIIDSISECMVYLESETAIMSADYASYLIAPNG